MLIYGAKSENVFRGQQPLHITIISLCIWGRSISKYTPIFNDTAPLQFIHVFFRLLNNSF